MILLVNYNTYIKDKINIVKSKFNIDTRNLHKLNEKDIINLYNFLNEKFENILLPKEIYFKEKKEYFISEKLYFITDNNRKDIIIKFYPIEDNTFITKYNLFNKYGNFNIVEDDNYKNKVPDITHLSTDTDININISDIINSNYSTEEKIKSNDTELNTTESILNDININI